MVPILTVQYSIMLPLILVKISDDSKDYYYLIIIAVGIVVFLTLGLRLCYARRGRCAVVLRRRVACSATAPIVENDELQREHEEAEQEQLDYPLLYTPTAEPLEGCTTNNGQNPYQAQEEEMVNAEEGPGVPQGSTMEPPPPYSPNPAAISSESTNSTQTDPAQREEITDNTRSL